MELSHAEKISRPNFKIDIGASLGFSFRGGLFSLRIRPGVISGGVGGDDFLEPCNETEWQMFRIREGSIFQKIAN